MRRWTEPLDLPLLRSQNNVIWSLALVLVNVDSATHDVVVQRGANPNPNSDLIQTHTRLYCRCYMMRWTEPLDLPLLQSQTNVIWSLALAQVNVDSATHDMVAVSGANPNPNSDLIRTHTRL